MKMLQSYTIKPKRNHRVMAAESDEGNLYFEMRIVDGIKSERSLYDHRLGMDVTTFKLSREAAQALLQLLAYIFKNSTFEANENL